MSTNKLIIILLSSFLAAALVCLAVGIGLYFIAIGLPASADGRGARVLAGIVVMAVGAMTAVISLAAMAVLAIRHFINKKK